ncbi:Hypothetical predicted protein [Olea europaea subsp. europaea]|uniref:Uncharacterized protein n=1 Tax=Olea europaea subsp. europaea TaxID=158383 RepID=A0A8S0TTG7_OLEEU|nr:Hypothetical predicted protein [Olea europaea subsp. europaea]
MGAPWGSRCYRLVANGIGVVGKSLVALVLVYEWRDLDSDEDTLWWCLVGQVARCYSGTEVYPVVMVLESICDGRV